VGLTGLSPEEPFENHLTGWKSSRLVEEYGVRLLPELYEHLNPMPYAVAARTEGSLPKNSAKRVTRCGATEVIVR
jgi:hypothetical protein